MRGNIFVTKVLGSYLKVICGGALVFPLKELIEEAVTNVGNYEVDPQKLAEGHNLEDNMTRLIDILQRFIQIITDTVSIMPK